MMQYATISLDEDDRAGFTSSGSDEDRVMIRLNLNYEMPLTIFCTPEQAAELARTMVDAVIKADRDRKNRATYQGEDEEE